MPMIISTLRVWIFWAMPCRVLDLRGTPIRSCFHHTVSVLKHVRLLMLAKSLFNIDDGKALQHQWQLLPRSFSPATAQQDMVSSTLRRKLGRETNILRNLALIRAEGEASLQCQY